MMNTMFQQHSDEILFPGDDHPLPFFFVGDDAFPMREWLMKPYPIRGMTHSERVFNYRLSRARRVVENAFGITAHRFRCMLGTMLPDPDVVEDAVLACCTLHNYLREKQPTLTLSLVDTEDPNTHEVIPGSWRTDRALDGLEKMRGNNALQKAKGQREYLTQYYSSAQGRVEWQDRMV